MAKQNKQKQSKTEKKFRTPIIAVMGHVDHGKTSLLDALRGTKVFESEVGGITQNTRAHQIKTGAGNKITFVDTPGHEAFSKMRERGARVTDFVLLVVAADDGVQPQTIESIKFAQESKTPIVVAVNKMDLNVKSIDKLKKQLSDHGVLIEEYGGDTMLFEVSAVKKTGLKELVEGIELLAEIHELKENNLGYKGTVGNAFVLESNLDKKMGSIALCILKSGSLKGRESVITAENVFKARSYINEEMSTLEEVHESDPFILTGLRDTLETGELIYFTDNDKASKDLQKEIFENNDGQDESLSQQMSASDMISQMFARKEEKKEGLEQKHLYVIVKSSTEGTLEAVVSELERLGDEDRKLKILEASVGEVSEKDIDRAKAAKGLVLAFQLPVSKKVADIAKRERVLVRNYEIIYEMLEEVEVALDSLLEPEEYEVEVARANVKKIFTLTNGDIVAGCEVVKGTITRGYNAYVERGEEEIGRGRINKLRHFKDEVKEVKKGLECGILLSPAVEDLKEGDDIVTYKVEKN